MTDKQMLQKLEKAMKAIEVARDALYEVEKGCPLQASRSKIQDQRFALNTAGSRIYETHDALTQTCTLYPKDKVVVASDALKRKGIEWRPSEGHGVVVDREGDTIAVLLKGREHAVYCSRTEMVLLREW